MLPHWQKQHLLKPFTLGPSVTNSLIQLVFLRITKTHGVQSHGLSYGTGCLPRVSPQKSLIAWACSLATSRGISRTHGKAMRTSLAPTRFCSSSWPQEAEA